MNKGFEQIRAYDRQEVQKLKISLDEIHKNSQANRELAVQQEELVKQLQSKINSIENTVVNVVVFQARALEVQEKLESVEQKLFIRLEAIQNYYRLADHSLNNICLKER